MYFEKPSTVTFRTKKRPPPVKDFKKDSFCAPVPSGKITVLTHIDTSMIFIWWSETWPTKSW